jgi:superfamily II DNA/RNA helicase
MAVSRPSSTLSSSAQSTSPFADLGVPPVIVDALTRNGITEPFPIQTATLPYTLAGRDVLGRGRTGSGKTYSFAIPVVARLAASTAPRRPLRPRALILAPTRELVSQIDATIAPLAAALKMRTITIFGGVGYGPQVSALRAGVDIVVACPGRLADIVADGNASLDGIEITVLDEADHMADLGFLPVVRRLLDQTPRQGQRMLFSATLDAGVDVLVKRYLTDPITQSVDSAASPVATMAHHVLHVRTEDRLPVLVELASAPGRTLVFARTKHRTKTLTRQLIASGVPAVELHGNLAQNARTRNLEAFSNGTAKTLVATDIAARGIHVDDIALVIHADPPAEHKAYLHRSGRTARAGASGTVITLMTDEQVADVAALARQAGIKPTTTKLRPGHALLTELAPGERTFVEPTAPVVLLEDRENDGTRGRRRRPAVAGAGGGSPRGRGGSAGGRGAAQAGSGQPSRAADGASGRNGDGRGAAPRGDGGAAGGRGSGGGRSAASRGSGGGRSGGAGGGRGGSSGGRTLTTYSTSTPTSGSSGGTASGGTSSGGIAAFSANSRGGRRGR